MTLYRYTFYNDDVIADQLETEIRSTAIPVALNHVETVGPQVDSYFKATLSGSEQHLLGLTVSGHVPDYSILTPEPVLMHHLSEDGTGSQAMYFQPQAGDGKPRVLASHKPVLKGKEAYNFFTSRGDHIPSGVIASGNALMLEATSGTSMSWVDLHFATEVNPQEIVYLFGGAISWADAGWGDCFNVEIRTIPTPVVPDPPAGGMGLDVDYVLDGERIMYAGAPGSGTHALGGYPAWVPNFNHTGHWNLNATKDGAVPAASGTGAFDWYITDQFVGHYVADLLTYGTSANPLTIDATEAAPLPYGTYLRVRIHNNSDTDWKLWGFMKLYRERLK